MSQNGAQPNDFGPRDFQPPRSLKDAFQRFSLELNCMMVWFRDEAHYHDAMDAATLETAQLLIALLADSLQEAETLLPALERRVTGADLAEGSRQ